MRPHEDPIKENEIRLFTMEATDMGYGDHNMTELMPDIPESYFSSHLSQVSLNDLLPTIFNEVAFTPSPSVTAEIEDNSRDYNIKEEIKEYHVVQIHKPIQLQCGPPTRGDLPGPYDFQVHVNGNDTHKKKYVYSALLNRIYVGVECCFSLQFSWNFGQTMAPMFVRSTLVFSDTSQYEKRVERCVQHKHMKKEGQDDSIVNHVLRSARETGAEGVTYCGDVSRSDSWYSVLVQFNNLPSAPAQSCTHAYMFACKNSCSSGINRRSIEILFTLEDVHGRVYGRQTVGVRVCACPRRDMVKEEDETKGQKGKGKKRIVDSAATTDRPPPAKKIQLDVVQTPSASDDKVYTLNSEVVGSKVLETGLTVMINMMEVGAARADSRSLEKYTKCITNMKTQLEQLKNTDKK